MKILIVTSEWPRFDGDLAGIHVVNQIKTLENAGLTVEVFPFEGRKNPYNYWRASRKIKQIRLEDFDLIHAHHGQAGLVALSQKVRPVVVTFHGSDLQGIRDRSGRVAPLGYVLRFTSRWVASHAQEVILVAPHLARHLPRSVKYQVIPAGIDTTLFRPIPMATARRSLGLPPNKHLILFVGDPSRTEKRHWLAQAATQRLQQDMDAQLVTADNIPHEKMPLYLNACDVLLLTSSTEGSPTIVKEALACNLPIVSTDVGDVRTRLAEVDGCFVISDDHPETIVWALQMVLDQSGRIKGRENVLALDESNLIHRVIDVYEKVKAKR